MQLLWSLIAPFAQEGPEIGLVLSCIILEILNFFFFTMGPYIFIFHGAL